MRKNNSRTTRNAFTLVELLIVVVLIAILASIAVPEFINAGERAREAALRADLKLYRNAIELFENDTDVFPTALTDLAATTAPATGTAPGGASTPAIDPSLWFGPYIYAIEADPTQPGVTVALSWTYTPAAGTVVSTNAGTGLDGTLFSTW